MDDIYEDLLRERLEDVENEIVEFEQNATSELKIRLKRSLHTLKGELSFCGESFKRAYSLVHQVEDIVDNPTPDAVLMLSCIDYIRYILDNNLDAAERCLEFCEGRIKKL